MRLVAVIVSHSFSAIFPDVITYIRRLLIRIPLHQTTANFLAGNNPFRTLHIA
jgi:hypothetical protein